MNTENMQESLEAMFQCQLKQWPLCAAHYEALRESETKTIRIDGRDYRLQYNPARMRSAGAEVHDGKVDRPCFLCQDLRPKEQTALRCIVPATAHEYDLLVNPYPIVNHHFTIAAAEHTRQTLVGRVGDMAHFAQSLPDYLIFFNGACSGASAPDHQHFQAVPKSAVPLLAWPVEQQILCCVTSQEPVIDDSDRQNVLCWTEASTTGRALRWLVVRRVRHRPWQYAAGGDKQCLISPASLEFAGLVPLARKIDFDRMDAALLTDVLTQVECKEPHLRVGIMEGASIGFTSVGVRHTATYLAEDRLLVDGVEQSDLWVTNDPFVLHDVTIGKQFHWEQKEDQTFDGALHIIAREGVLHAINVVAVEDYLQSVIASEMSAGNNIELLKTHAIISRSWVLRQLEAKQEAATEPVSAPAGRASDTYLYWYDHDDHQLFDVCADDHCQRYQGTTRVVSETVRRAVQDTRGEVLLDRAGKICDARFSKCCGGVSESFDTCWQERSYEYLQPIVDDAVDLRFVGSESSESEASLQSVGSESSEFEASLQDEVKEKICNPSIGKSRVDVRTARAAALSLDTEAGVRRWIETTVDASFCNTHNALVLRQVLNNYDQKTLDFYRWEVSYTQEELSALVERKMHFGLGRICHLRPLKRGLSGRICILQIEGEQRSMTIGKELVIRMALSETHLYSSAFVVDELTHPDGTLTFIIKGAGWGHGVGLCQIGAATMSLNGYSYRQILKHYFMDSCIRTIY